MGEGKASQHVRKVSNVYSVSLTRIYLITTIMEYRFHMESHCILSLTDPSSAIHTYLKAPIILPHINHDNVISAENAKQVWRDLCGFSLSLSPIILIHNLIFTD